MSSTDYLEFTGEIGPRVIDCPWLFSILNPEWRFVREVDGDLHIATGPNVIRFCLQRAYEQEIRRELIDPEWPCPYYDALVDSYD